ncbi:MAG: M20 family metallo-hydrolase [Desulfovibrio sp.]|nr:M20 family metallo-hydrolase [Desulfovibrio sp.]
MTSQHNALRTICTDIEKSDKDVFALQSTLTSFRALPPEHGGDGEAKKAAWLEAYLREELGVNEILSLNAKDARVSSGMRPNLIARIPGRQHRTLWIFTHLDVVSEGDRNAWDTDPWDVVQKGDLLYGRGVEDNQQATVSALLLARALNRNAITPYLSLGMVFMADEECGNTYGLSHVLKEKPDLFRKNDIYLVPDFGDPSAAVIEVAEKAMLWLKIETTGKQGHASTPHKGRNAFLAGSEMVVALSKSLPEAFPETNALFSPPCSTFVPSMHEANVNGINILPGHNTFYLDCRILPGTDIRAVREMAEKICASISRRHNVQTTVTCVHSQRASSIDPESTSVQALKNAIRAVYSIDAKAKGIGGGTVASCLREKGLDAMAWSCLDNTCHTPNEHSSVSATKNDTLVFAHMLFSS